MRSRRSLRFLGIVALTAMVFAQAAFALAACDDYRAQSRALLAATEQAETIGCHEAEVNANICLAHCQGRDQTLDKHRVNVPAASLHPVLTIRSGQPARQPDLVFARLPQAIAAPPARILFQSLLI
ncbi:MAG TPA: hypothetical protein VLF65_07505 [Burkholderiales bacterium]|jgi:hypothetical protein|nr:hypothetical protein [Burkholderiales bacterium]